MATDFSVALKKIIDEVSLKSIFMPSDPSEIMITSVDISRPGLQLTGFFDFFDKTRILIFGKTEFSFLSRFGIEQQHHVLNSIFEFGPPAIILCRDYEPTDVMLQSAHEHSIPILQSSESTSALSANLVTFLNSELAPRITRHGVLVEV